MNTESTECRPRMWRAEEDCSRHYSLRVDMSWWIMVHGLSIDGVNVTFLYFWVQYKIVWLIEVLKHDLWHFFIVLQTTIHGLFACVFLCNVVHLSRNFYFTNLFV